MPANVPLEDGDAVAAADVVRDFGSEGLVVHKEKINFPDVVHQEFLEAIGEEMACLFVATVTDLKVS